jgi:hypothetical protein
MSKLGRVDAVSLATVGQHNFCTYCFAEGRSQFHNYGFDVLRYSDFLSADDKALARHIAESVPMSEIATFTWHDLAIGEHAHAGALRFFACGDLAGEPYGQAVLRKYFEAGLLTALGYRNLLRSRRFDVVVAHHGIYVPQGIICDVARQEAMRVVTWNPAYRKHCFIFSHDETYHHSMITEPTSVWEDLELTGRHQADLQRYLHSRRFGTNDWIWFHDQPVEDADAILAELGVDSGKPYVCLLTSVVWDAQLHYRSNAFPNMLAWVRETIEYFAKRDNLQLVIRVHPAEVRGLIPSRQRMADEISRLFPQLPPNVFVVPPNNQASTYALSERANAILIYNTKAGVELASIGQFVIVAGEAWIRGKRFSLDASNPREYLELLDRLPLQAGLDAEKQARALRYAYHFFFRRMIPLPFIKQDQSGVKFSVDIASRADLRPGRFLGLDVICNGILQGSPFVYPAEALAAGPADDR